MTSKNHISQSDLKFIKNVVVESVEKASIYVSSKFGKKLKISSKSGIAGRDLVSEADKNSQKIIEKVMSKKFPSHPLLGEEDPPNSDRKPGDWIWAVDPIDGTNNFVNNSQQYAISVSVLYKGAPIVGAIWIPWANSKKNGIIMESFKGGGTWIGNKKIIIPKTNTKPVNGRLSGLPHQLSNFKLHKNIKNSLGEERVIGSTAYELFMVANGSLQFAISGFANVWDFAASIILIQEAEGKINCLNNNGIFSDFNGWIQPYCNKYETYNKLREWKGIFLAGNPEIVDYLSSHIEFNRKKNFLFF